MEQLKDIDTNRLKIKTEVVFDIRDLDETTESAITISYTPTLADVSELKICQVETVRSEDILKCNDLTPVMPYSIFTKCQKVMIVFIASFASIIASFSAYIYLPAFVVIQKVRNGYLFNEKVTYTKR